MNEKIIAQEEQGPVYAVEAQLTARHADGSVVGSYPAETMEALLHYHNLPQVGMAAGSVLMAGEAPQF